MTDDQLRTAAHRHFPHLVPATIAARMSIWIWAAYGILQGVLVIKGGPQRWASATFDVLRAAPNPTLFWGLTLICLGVALLAASLFQLFWLKAGCCCGMAVWSLCFAFGSLRAATRNPALASTGGPTYLAISAAVLVLVFVDERRHSALFVEEETRLKIGGHDNADAAPPPTTPR